jgi:hypothetical protein
MFRRAFEPPRLPRRRRGGLLGSALDSAVSRVTSHTMPDAEGVADFAGDRVGVDFGSFAQLWIGDRHWSGRSGRALATLPPDEFGLGLHCPLWGFHLLAGAVEETPAGEEPVRGVPCRRFAVLGDLGAASAAIGGGLRVPMSAVYEDLARLAVDAWIDAEGRVRRVHWREHLGDLTTELHDFGAAPPVDWTRMPSFKTD